MSPRIIHPDDSSFEAEVLERSREIPVLVDFWAPWCQPCLVLGPPLEEVAGEFSGRLVLAKVDIDEHQRLAGRYRVRGIPDVRAFVDGREVDAFTGALPESEIRTFVAGLPAPGSANAWPGARDGD